MVRDREKRDAGRGREERSVPVMALAGLAGLSVACGLWSLFLWRRLLVARGGGEVTCALGGDAACSALWQASVVVGIESISGLPVAALGFLWSLVALALALSAIRRRGAIPAVLLGATHVTACVGLLSVLLLVALSIHLGLLCRDCALVYGLVGGYAGIAFHSIRGIGIRGLARGAAAAALLAVAGWIPLAIVSARVSSAIPAPVRFESVRSSGADPGTEAAPRPGTAATLDTFLRSLDERQRRSLFEALMAFRAAPVAASRPPRALEGSASAPVVLTEFTDTLCGACASFQEVIAELRRVLPSDAFAVEQRHFPLDAACNPAALARDEAGHLRCLAARARICMESSGQAYAFTGELFRRQSSLTEAMLFEVSDRYVARDGLERCMASPETHDRLADDIAWALEHQIRGTPLVLVNGRRAPLHPGLIYALILAHGDGQHPAFGSLAPSSSRSSR